MQKWLGRPRNKHQMAFKWNWAIKVIFIASSSLLLYVCMCFFLAKESELLQLTLMIHQKDSFHNGGEYKKKGFSEDWTTRCPYKNSKLLCLHKYQISFCLSSCLIVQFESLINYSLSKPEILSWLHKETLVHNAILCPFAKDFWLSYKFDETWYRFVFQSEINW